MPCQKFAAHSRCCWTPMLSLTMKQQNSIHATYELPVATSHPIWFTTLPLSLQVPFHESKMMQLVSLFWVEKRLRCTKPIFRHNNLLRQWHSKSWDSQKANCSTDFLIQVDLLERRSNDNSWSFTSNGQESFNPSCSMNDDSNKLICPLTDLDYRSVKF